jgi:ribulose-phosphate 3-epimerase
LIMSVDPGFGGQSYIPASTGRIAKVRERLEEMGSGAWLEVDGGIIPENAAEIVGAGADVLVAGSAIFRGSRSIVENVAAFREAIAGR